MRCLSTSFNQEATRALEQQEDEEMNEVSNDETGMKKEDQDQATQSNRTNYIYDMMMKTFAFMTQSVLTEDTQENTQEETQENTSRKQYGKQDITFQEAWNHPDPETREKWREVIRKEFHCMLKRKVWRKVKRSTIPKERRLIKC